MKSFKQYLQEQVQDASRLVWTSEPGDGSLPRLRPWHKRPYSTGDPREVLPDGTIIPGDPHSIPKGAWTFYDDLDYEEPLSDGGFVHDGPTKCNHMNQCEPLAVKPLTDPTDDPNQNCWSDAQGNLHCEEGEGSIRSITHWPCGTWPAGPCQE